MQMESALPKENERVPNNPILPVMLHHSVTDRPTKVMCDHMGRLHTPVRDPARGIA